MQLTQATHERLSFLKSSFRREIPKQSNSSTRPILEQFHRILKGIPKSRHSITFATASSIYSPTDIPFSQSLNPKSLDKMVLNHIYTYSKYTVQHNIRIDESFHIRVFYVVEKRTASDKIKQCSELIYLLFAFLKTFLPTEKQQKKQNRTIDVYIYMTSLVKELPALQNQPLGYFQVNTGMTYANGSEIVIFREEEWFKVLIHECFHCLSFDFSEQDPGLANHLLKQLFFVNVHILLSESYAEFWANILNLTIISFLNTRTLQTFQSMFFALLEYEKQFKLLQMAKVLRNHNLSYKDLRNKVLAKTFKENTNVFAYYVLGGILVYHTESFFTFCFRHNKNILQSISSNKYIEDLCRFIELESNENGFLSMVLQAEKILDNIRRNSKLKTTLRMTSFEIKTLS